MDCAGNEHISLLCAAVFLKDSIHDDQDQAVSGKDQKRGESQCDDPFHHPGTVLTKGDPNRNLFPWILSEEKEHGKCTGEKL